MPSVPRYTKTVIRPRAVPNTVDPGAIGRAAAPFETVSKVADFSANLIERERQAVNATKLNSAVIEYKKRSLLLQDDLRQKNSLTPEGFSSVYEEEAKKLKQDFMKGFTDGEVRQAFDSTSEGVDLQNFNSALTWQRKRGAEVGLDRTNAALQAVYDRASAGGDLGEAFRDIDASVVAAGTLGVDKLKLKGLQGGAKDNAVKHAISGAMSRNDPQRASAILDKHREVLGGTEAAVQQQAIDNKLLHLNKIRSEEEILGVLRNENAFLTKTLEKPATFAEIQRASEQDGISAPAQSYFFKANGFTKDATALSDGEKLEFKAGLYGAIAQAEEAGDVSSEDISKLQGLVYEGMENESLTKKEGLEYLNGILGPAVDSKSEALKSFQIGKFNPFQDNIGFSGLNETLKELEVKPPSGEDLGQLGQFVNNENKVKLYDFYNEQLNIAAQEGGIKVGEISSLPKSQKREIYSKAQTEAKRLFFTDKFPDLGSMEEMPASIITSDGRRIKTGLNSGKSSASVSVPEAKHSFDTEAEMDAADLPDGTPVTVGGVQGTVRK